MTDGLCMRFTISEFCTQELFLPQNGIVQALHDQLHCLDSLDYQRLRQVPIYLRLRKRWVL